MQKNRGPFLKGEFPVICAVLCAMILRLAFYPASRTPIAVYGTIGGVILFAIVVYFSWRSSSKG